MTDHTTEQVALTEDEIGTLFCRCLGGICPIHNETSDMYVEHRVDELIDAINEILADRQAAVERRRVGWTCPDCGWAQKPHPKYGWQRHDETAVKIHRDVFCSGRPITSGSEGSDG